jgi:hypothetical protein
MSNAKVRARRRRRALYRRPDPPPPTPEELALKAERRAECERLIAELPCIPLSPRPGTKLHALMMFAAIASLGVRL